MKLKTAAKLTLIAALAIMFFGCRGSQASSDAVPFKVSTSMNTLADAIKEVRLIPVSNEDGHLTGSRVELLHQDGNYILCDMENGNIFRYDEEGAFLNAIGRKGNGPGEYVSLQNANIQVLGADTLAIFTGFGDLLYYSPDGAFLKQVKIDNPGMQSLQLDEGILTYFGYTSEASHRLALVRDGVTTEEYLPTRNPAITLSSSIPLLTRNGSSAFVIDSFNDILFKYESGSLTPYLEFDFGKYKVPETYYKAEDPFEGAEALLGSAFAFIQRYMEGDSYKLVEIVVQDQPDSFMEYGLSHHDGNWVWFGEGKDKGYNFFNDGPRLMEGNRLISLIAPERLDGALKFFSPFLKVRPEGLDPDGLNCVIAEIELK